MSEQDRLGEFKLGRADFFTERFEVDVVTLSSGASGRFRLWEDQHRSLTASDGQATAWYAFVLLSGTGEVVDVRRMKPSTVTEIVGGDWNRADHAERDGRQHKLPADEVFS